MKPKYKNITFLCFMGIAVINLGNYFLTKEFLTKSQQSSLFFWALFGFLGALLTYNTMKYPDEPDNL